MGCADYRLYCDGDSDGDGNDLMHGVLDKKSVLELFQGALAFFVGLPYIALATQHLPRPMSSSMNFMG